MRPVYRLFTLLLAIPVIILVAVFAASNRQTVSVGLFPLPFEVDVPLYLLPLLGILFGFLWGAAVMWLSGSNLRRQVAEEKRSKKTMRDNLKDAMRRADHAERVLEGMASTPPQSLIADNVHTLDADAESRRTRPQANTGAPLQPSSDPVKREKA